MGRVIFHVDINSYFATMLQQENPMLRGRPVGVVKSEGRTCIIASSNEAKLLGIKTGTSKMDALTKAPHLTLVPAQFDIMLSATRRLKALFTSLAPNVHIFSLDEVFLDLTGCESVIRQQVGKYDLIFYGKFIQRTIQKQLGEWVQCNVGISHNKLLAKMAGEIAPKGSVYLITPDNLDEVLLKVTFKDVCGVGARLTRKLEYLNVFHPYQLNLLDDATLLASFGPHWASELRKIGRGEETHFFSHPRKTDFQQSVGRTITGYRLCDNEAQIKCTLLNLLEEATHKLRAMDLSGRKIGISLWGHSEYWGAHRTLRYWVRHTNEIFELLYDGMYKEWKRTFPVIKYGVWIGDCQPNAQLPQNLLPNWHRQEKLYSLIDQVNDRFGSFTLKPASFVGFDVIHPEVTGYLGDRIYLGL